jgi:hypothetical protein
MYSRFVGFFSIEHVRDLANTLAYGRAIGHLYPVGEWRHAIAASGSTLLIEERITPFVVLPSVEEPS